MIENPYYTCATHGAYDVISAGRLDLEQGGTIPDCRLAVATWGELNEARDNAVLIPTWFSGTHAIWRDVYIGTDRALDPSRYFIVAVNQIGSGLSVSPHNADGANAHLSMSSFPEVTIGDDVVAQERLLRQHFGVDRLALVVGGSMGAQQTYEWAVRFPEKVLRAAPIAGTARCTPHGQLLVQALMDQIRCSPGWNGGRYTSAADVVDGLTRHADLWAVIGFSAEFWGQEAWRGLGFDSREGFLDGFLRPYFTAMDPADLLCMAWKWQHADVARHTGGDLAAALSRITARVRVLAIDEDLTCPIRDCRADQEMIKDADLRVIEDVAGHLALFGVSPTYLPQIDRHLGELLAADVRTPAAR